MIDQMFIMKLQGVAQSIEYSDILYFTINWNFIK